ncbi:unnamed protein product [Phaeothamnion confervicola]
MAEQLGKLVDEAGGPAHAIHLLSPLEQLAAVEEAAVRAAAVASCLAVAARLPPSALAEPYLAMVTALATRDWFTARMSACVLVAPIYARLPPSPPPPARALFTQLCRDDTPMVRRVAAANLGPLAAAAEPWAAVMDLLPLFSALAEDDQDSVRLQTVDNCVAFSRAVPPPVCAQRVLPVLLETANDRSWRVRWSVANKLHDVCAALGPEVRIAVY